jgi:hypothetical protein
LWLANSTIIKKGQVMNASENNDAMIAKLMPEMHTRMGNPGAIYTWIATLTAAEQAAITAWLSEPGDRIHDMLKRIAEELSETACSARCGQAGRD